MGIEHRRTSPSSSATSPRCDGVDLDDRRRASWSRCSARRARARPRCCASSPGSSSPTPARVLFGGEDWPRAPVRERHVGFVFQHYALFRHMTRVRERRLRPARAAARARGPREAEIRERVQRTARPGAARRARATAIPRSSPAASASAWRWRARWPSSRACCCSTSPSARSTPRCARSCAAGCASCTTTSARHHACSSPTTRKRRSSWPTAWWS